MGKPSQDVKKSLFYSLGPIYLKVRLFNLTDSFRIKDCIAWFCVIWRNINLNILRDVVNYSYEASLECFRRAIRAMYCICKEEHVFSCHS
jgi:hypothetical protein